MKLHVVASMIIISLLIIYLLIFSSKNIMEGFGELKAFNVCGDCNTVGKKGVSECLSCTNCGWCTDPNGYGSCVMGDYTGPYFADCSQFMFGGGVAISGPGSGQGGTGPAIGSASNATPFNVSLAGALQNVAPSPFGNTFYKTDAPLRSARRWRPPGNYRDYYD